jgi:hypothetical protein
LELIYSCGWSSYDLDIFPKTPSPNI